MTASASRSPDSLTAIVPASSGEKFFCGIGTCPAAFVTPQDRDAHRREWHTPKSSGPSPFYDPSRNQKPRAGGAAPNFRLNPLRHRGRNQR